APSLHPFPTRRSSDLLAATIGARNLLLVWAACLVGACLLAAGVLGVRPRVGVVRRRARQRPSVFRDMTEGLSFVRRSPLLVWMRSEEHTSELQSRSDL